MPCLTDQWKIISLSNFFNSTILKTDTTFFSTPPTGITGLCCSASVHSDVAF